MIVVACLAVSLLATVGGVGIFAYAKGLNDDLERMDAFDGLEDRPDKAVSGTFNMLILGTDTRDPDGDDPARADTIMMLHVPADGEDAFIVSLPRDLWVEIPAGGDWAGGHEKLNSAQFFGGVPLMVNTVESYTGVYIDHVLEIDFDGLEAVVDALGGVDMPVEPATNPEYGDEQWQSIHKNDDGEYNTFEAGVEEDMSGERALDYVRQRYQFADGDFTRMRNQQALLMAMMDKATSSGIVGSPNKLRSFLDSVTDTVVVDEQFNLIDTGLRFSDLRSDDLTFLTSPITGSEDIEGQSVVAEDAETAAAMYTAVNEDGLKDWLDENPSVLGEDED